MSDDMVKERAKQLNGKPYRNEDIARIKVLFKKHQSFFKKIKKLADFKEPVALLIRKSGLVEFYEDVNAGDWRIEHSDGSTRVISMHKSKLVNFDYGPNTFRGYICHEDSPAPITDAPVTIGQSFTISYDKSLHDQKTWSAKMRQATGDLVWKIALGIAVILGVMIVGAFFGVDVASLMPWNGGAPPVPPETVINVTVPGTPTTI